MSGIGNLFAPRQPVAPTVIVPEATPTATLPTARQLADDAAARRRRRQRRSRRQGRASTVLTEPFANTNLGA